MVVEMIKKANNYLNETIMLKFPHCCNIVDDDNEYYGVNVKAHHIL